jgi:hypothetical protein
MNPPLALFRDIPGINSQMVEVSIKKKPAFLEAGRLLFCFVK